MAQDIYFNNPQNRKTDSQGKTKSPASVYAERLKQPLPEEPEEPMKTSAPKKPQKNKKRRKKRPLIAVLCLLLVLVIGAVGAVFGVAAYVVSDYQPQTLEDNAYIDDTDLMHSAGVYNILLMGVDTDSTQENTRSDAMILMSINTLSQSIKLTSFMRDMYVTVPGHGETKLTHACQYGGPQLTVDSIEYDFHIKIDAYAKIGYDLLIELVDGVGGVTVAEIDETEAAALEIAEAYVGPGTDIHLNGFEAVQYCRIRKGQSDFQRTERQREMITLVIRKMLKTNPAVLLKLAKSIAGKIQCSMDTSDLYALAFKAIPCFIGDIETQQIPADGTWDNGTRSGMSVLLVNLEKNREIIKDFIYG